MTSVPGDEWTVGQWPATGRGGADGPASPAVPECHDDVCVTCSDSAVPVTIVRLLEDGLAVVDTGSGVEEVSVAFVSAAPGDIILVHAGEAIAVVPS
jgi:hydrogenase expression/formation protein HypC